jgi:hypothetical protein
MLCSRQLVFLDQLCSMLTIGCKTSERTVWYVGIDVDDTIEMVETIDI